MRQNNYYTCFGSGFTIQELLQCHSLFETRLKHVVKLTKGECDGRKMEETKTRLSKQEHVIPSLRS